MKNIGALLATDVQAQHLPISPPGAGNAKTRFSCYTI